MGAIATPTVTLFLNLPFDSGNFWTIGDPTKGQLDSTYGLAGDIGTDITASAFDISIQRGRSGHLDDIGVGTASVSLRNYTRDWDPLNTASPYYGFLKPGGAVNIEVYGQRIYTGYVDDWANTYSVAGEAVASFPCIDALGILGRQQFNAWTTTAGQTAGPRLTDVLNRPEVAWPAAARDIDTGVSTLTGDNVTWGSNPYNYTQLIAQTEQGMFRADRNGVLVFDGRTTLINPTPVLTFADDGTGYPFVDPAELTGAAERFVSQVSIDREGGIVQTASDDFVGQASAIRRLSLQGLLYDSDEQSMGLAQWLLGQYKTPAPRVKTLTVNMAAIDTDADRAAIAALDLNDVIHVKWTPQNTGSTIADDYSIDGIGHHLPFDGAHYVTLTLTPIAQKAAWTIGDPILGALDSVARISF